MDGLMMDRPLLVKQIAERAERVFADREVVARTQDGIERSRYGRVVERARRLASALTALGVKPGDRVASFAWNSLRHLELYLAVPSMGAVLHTLNIRLFEDDLRYVVDHAGDKVIFLDASLAGAMPSFEGVEREIVMPDGPGERDGALDYEELVADGDPRFELPELEENTAAAMCYTCGTTGQPKGVRVLAPVDRPPHAGGGPAGLDGRPRGRHRVAGGPDVPREGLGTPVLAAMVGPARCCRGRF